MARVALVGPSTTTAHALEDRRMLFLSAACGNLAPLLLRWYAEERVTMPGGAVGGLLAVLLFAIFAGFVAVFVWQEKTVRQAFFIGLALPYVLTGSLADLQQLRVRSAHAQWGGFAGGHGGASASATMAVLQLAVVGPDHQKVEKYNTRILAADRELAIVTRNPGEILVPPGKYRVLVSAPGYRTTALNVTLESTEKRELPVVLANSTFAEDVWGGFRAIILPTRDWLVP